MAHQSHIKSEKYRQWVKAGLGLGYLKEGLAPFCDDIAKQQHTDIIENIKWTKSLPSVLCGTCTLKTLQPDHVKLGNKQCPLRHTNCNCWYTSGKIPCPNNVCGAIYDSIIGYHASTPPAPYWKNTQTQQWKADPWSIAKCFINAPGYEQNTSAADTDCTGLLHVIINNKYFRNHVSCNMTGPNIFSKVRQNRNEIYQSNTMELDSTKTNNYIDDMIAVLQDGKELINRQDAQDAVKKLQDLKKEAFIITTEDISLIMRTTEGLAKDNEDIKRKFANLESIITELKEDTSAKKKREYDSSKADLQQRLIKEYRQNLLFMPAMPFEPKDTRNFKDVYVTPEITIKSKDKDGKDIETEVNEMSDVFNKDNQCFKSIYILGEAGSGKSSLCKMNVNCWCMAHSDRQDLDCQQAGENTEDHDDLIKVMKRFNFLFFLPLRLYTDKVSIEDMLEHSYRHCVLKVLLENESEKCLIVLDGLDEWTHNSTCLPQRTLGSNYTVLTTSRSWKIASLDISDNEMEHSFHIIGFCFESKKNMITKIVNILDKTFKKDKDPQICENALTNTSFYSLTHTAMMLQQLVCLWYDDKLHETSKCHLYTCMLDLFFVWHKKKAPGAPLFNALLNKSIGLELPELLNDTDECKFHKYIVQGVARLAYETLIKNEKETSLTFDSSIFQQLDISNYIKDCCLKLGILSEEKGPSLSASRSRKSHISFIHKSVQEYLAAVYIVMNIKTEHKSSFDMEGADLPHYLIEMLNVKTLDELLEQGNVLIMLCGLEPRFAKSTSKFVNDIVARDERVVKYRTSIIDYAHNEYLFIQNIQSLILHCIEEIKASNKLLQFSFDLGDLITKGVQDTARLIKGVCEQNIALDNAISVRVIPSILTEEYNGRIFDCITKCKRLEKLSVEYPFSEELHERVCDSIVAHASTLKCLSVRYTPGFSSLVRRTLFRRIANLTHLVALQVQGFTETDDDFTSLCTFLSNASNLQQISIQIYCKGGQQHVVDLSKHKHLQYLEYGEPVVVTDAEFTNLEVIRCYILNKNNCLKILDFLNSSRNLKEIFLAYDEIDIGKDFQLGNMSEDYGASDFYSIVTKRLITCFSSSQQLCFLILNNFTFTDNIIKCPSEMQSIEFVDLTNGKMSLTTWLKFVDSVVELSKPVKVRALDMCITRDGEECNPDIHRWGRDGEEAAAFQYVREREALFDVSFVREDSIVFSTKK